MAHDQHSGGGRGLLGGAPPAVGPVSHWFRRFGAIGIVVVLLAAVGVWWSSSRLPGHFSAMAMGTPDWGGGPESASGADPGHGAHGAAGAPAGHPGVSITGLVVDPVRAADVRVELVARQGLVHLADGRTLPGFTLNGSSPGPSIEAIEGDLVEVVLRNADVVDGTTLHWHGLNVPNGVDGVAGVTQDAVLPGQEYVYRFIADQVGTYWYHSHQVSDPQVTGGLLGALVIRPRAAAPQTELTAVLHTYGGRRTVNGGDDARVPAPVGTAVRVRLINTDPGPMPVWVAGAGFRVLAIDGMDLTGPTQVRDQSVTLTAGARADLEVVVPENGARVQVPGASIVLGPGAPAPVAPPGIRLDLLSYGTPAPLGFDPAAATRVFDYRIGRRFGLLDGQPGAWWTINGKLYPDVPMFMVREGDVVRMRVSNDSGDVHPMHLHGHHL